MGQIYGAGLLNALPQTAVDTEEKQIAALTEFVDTGVVMSLYEVIADKVIRVYDNGNVQPVSEWVTDASEIAEVRRAMTFGGSRPSSHFRFLDGFHMLVPDVEAHGDPITIQLPDGNDFTFDYINMVSGLQQLQRIHKTVQNLPPAYFENEPLSQSEYAGFHQQIIDGITACMKAGVVYRL